MNKKLDWPTLLLFVALLFGAIIRFYPAITNGFPLNDGGMFYAMVQDLKANGYQLPQFTTYNNVDIPFAYPPLGLYITASFSDLLSVPDLTTFLYLPAFINTLSILVFYLFAKETLNSRLTASLATVIYALSSRAFLWQIMGGGVTRAFGMLFLLLMLWQATRLFRASNLPQADSSSLKNISVSPGNSNPIGVIYPLLLTILFGAGAVTSHPQTALHAALGGALIFAFYGRNKRGILSALIVGAGVILLTAPWWLSILSRHGFAPLLSAGQTSRRTLEFYLIVLKLHGPGNYLALPTLIFFYIGLWDSFKRRDFFFIVWIVLAYLIDTRGGDGVALFAESMLAGIGLLKLSAWINRIQEEQGEVILMMRRSQILIFGVLFYLILAASISDFQLVNTSLKSDDINMIEWVNSNIAGDKNFLLATGREFSMSDPVQEWFPTLTGQHSVTTMQGLEWILAEQFFPWYAQLTDFQHCADVNCVSAWSARNGADYDYLIVTVPPEGDESAFANSLRNLAVSTRSSALHLLVYDSENALVFEMKK